LAAGFAFGLGFIALLLFLENKSWKHQLPYLLVSVPTLIILPYFHQPMLLILGLFMIWYFFVWKNIRIFLLFTGFLAVGPILLQLHGLSGNTSSFAWYPGYLIHGTITLQSFLTYWFHNLGLHLFLIPLGFLFAPKKVKKVLFPIFVLFLIANLFKFSVEIAANHKFFNFFMIFGNMLSAYVIVKIWKGIHNSIPLKGNVGSMNTKECEGANKILRGFTSSLPIRSWIEKHGTENATKFSFATKAFRSSHLIICRFVDLFICLLFVLLTLSGVIDFFAVVNDQKIPVIDLPRNETAQWIVQNTPRDAVILNSSYLYNPISLAGRSIFLGWPYFPWSAGYTENRMTIMDTLYESKDPAIFCPLLAKYTISFVEVENVINHPDLPDIEPSYFRSLATPLFSLQNDAHMLYATESLCVGL